jgi:preprotein translocase subunit SecG
MQAVLIIVHLLVAVSLIFVVLLQRSEGGALGMGGGGSGLGGLFSPRGAANTLTKTTVILGIAFFATSMTLTILALGGRQANNALPTAPGQTAPANPNAPPTLPTRAPGAPAPAAPANTAPAAPSAPALPSLPPTK